MDFLPINWEVIENPLNWIIILLMLLIAGFVLHLLLPQMFPDQTAFVQPKAQGN